MIHDFSERRLRTILTWGTSDQQFQAWTAWVNELKGSVGPR